MGRRGNGEGSIIYLESRHKWRAAIQDGFKENGKPRMKYFYGDRRTDAANKLAEYRLLKHQGYNAISKENLAVLMPLWLQNIKRPALKPASYDRLESTVNNHVLPTLGSYAAAELSSDIIQVELINRMQDKGLSYSSVKKAYDALNDFLSHLTAKRSIMYNPMQLVTKPTRVNFEASEICPLTNEQIDALKAGCRLEYTTKKRIYPMGEAFLLILNTGLRMGEALALQWSDVDFTKRTLRVSKNLILIKNRKPGESKYVLKVQQNPKSQSGIRTITLNDAAIAALEGLKQAPAYSDTGFVIRTAKGAPVRPRSFQNTLDSIAGRVGMQKFGVHTLRHTFASKLFENGIDIKVISRILGHKSVGVTYNTYIHIIQKLEQEAMQTIDFN